MERAFANRNDAGRLLSEKLEKYAGNDDVIVLGLPRGGVPVAYEVAKRLRVPLDVFIVRKLGVPGFEELAAGAIASGGVRVLNEDVVRAIPYATEAIEAVTAKETAELQRREQTYREGRPAPELRDKIVILVDDGLATGATMQVNDSTSGRDDIGPDLLQRHRVAGLGALSDAEAGKHERDEKESNPRRRTAD